MQKKKKKKQKQKKNIIEHGLPMTPRRNAYKPGLIEHTKSQRKAKKPAPSFPTKGNNLRHQPGDMTIAATITFVRIYKRQNHEECIMQRKSPSAQNMSIFVFEFYLL